MIIFIFIIFVDKKIKKIIINDKCNYLLKILELLFLTKFKLTMIWWRLKMIISNYPPFIHDCDSKVVSKGRRNR